MWSEFFRFDLRYRAVTGTTRSVEQASIITGRTLGPASRARYSVWPGAVNPAARSGACAQRAAAARG